MNLHKKAAIIGITALTSIAAMSSLVFGRGGLLSVAKATNDPYTLSLASGTITSLTSEYSNGVFNTTTEEGNTVSWEYKYGKTSSGNLIELGSNNVGNPGYDDYYVGNTSPINTGKSISISFSGSSPYMVVFGSTDGSEFYRLDVLTSSYTVTTRGNGYFYYRFVNGSQNKESCVINSIDISYDCVLSEYSDETTDGAAKTVLFDESTTSVSSDTTTYMNGLRSEKSINIQKISGTSAIFAIPIDSVIGSNFGKMILELYIYTQNNPDADSSHTFSRITVAGSIGLNKRGSTSANYEFANGNGWTKAIINLPNIYESNYGQTITHVYFKTYYTSNINIDNVRIHYSGSYPDIPDSLINQYETNDLTNGSITQAYNGVSNTIDGSVHDTDSAQSCNITITKDYRMWYFAGMEVPMNGRTLRFSMKVGQYFSGQSSIIIALRFKYTVDETDKIYDTSSLVGTSKAGVTTTTVNGWIRMTIDFDLLMTQTLTDKTSDGYLGFSMAKVQTMYFDNMDVSVA